MRIFGRKLDLVGFILPVLILAGWHIAVKTGIIASYILPGPQNILHALTDFAHGKAALSPYSGKLAENLSISFLRVIIGFSIAAACGLVAGFMTGRISLVRRIIDPTVHAVRTVPGIGWLPIAMVWFGVGERTTVFLIALASFFPIYINTAYGASQVPPLLIRAGRMLGAEGLSLFKTVIFPSAFPSVVVGLRLGMGVAWAYLVLGELTGVTAGLGAVMMDSRMMGQIEMIIVSMICIALMGVITDRVLLFICRRILPTVG
ncbi:MAG TPA: ABC transporter permease [Anaerovoracaceae bacterium]|nr:ABC transporter permease [Anaerovoracaceae bacterium]